MKNFQIFAVVFDCPCNGVSGQAYICLLGEYTLPTPQNPNYSHGRPSLGGSPGWELPPAPLSEGE